MATWLPISPRRSGARTLTGAITLKSSSLGSSLRCFIRKRRTAPATMASTTSLTLPPSRFLISLTAGSSSSSHSKRRLGPISSLRDVRDAGTSQPEASE